MTTNRDCIVFDTFYYFKSSRKCIIHHIFLYTFLFISPYYMRHDVALDMIRICDNLYTNDKRVDIILNHEKQYICVGFCGSKEKVDWRRNLYFHKHTIKNDIAVHYGFCKQLFTNNRFINIYSRLYSLLFEHPSYELFITGHSSGGAIATLFGYLISPEISKRQIQIISFASPRIGNLAFKRDFSSKPNLKHWRITNQYDFVPKIPYFGFHHVGERIRIKNRNCLCKDYCNHLSKSYYQSLLDLDW